MSLTGLGKRGAIAAACAFAFAFSISPAMAQAPAPSAATQVSKAPLKGRVERVRVHGKSLEGNLMGAPDSPEVSIYLPPSYGKDKARRYPVIYFLHGYNGDDLQYLGPAGVRRLPEVIERAFAAGGVREMIIVVPNCMNAYGGCMYSNSPTTGNWEDYVAQDLVAYVDGHYRTIATRSARGLGGQSMGGYGALRIGMKHPEVYSSLWAMAPCCLTQGNPAPTKDGKPSALEGVKTVDALKAIEEAAKQNRGADNGVLVGFATAAAWSPNPDNAPFFLDLPTRDGAVVPEVAARYGANSPIAMVSQYAPNLRKYRAFQVDVGKDDPLLSSIREFDARLNQLKVPHGFSVREGNHNSQVVPQFELKILPFFSQNLTFERKGSARP